MQQNIQKRRKNNNYQLSYHKEKFGYNFINFNHSEGIEHQKDYNSIVVYYKL